MPATRIRVGGRQLGRIRPPSSRFPGFRVYDTFDRPNSATSLGSADTGQAWTALSGTWGVTANQAYNAAGSGDRFALVDSGSANADISATLQSTATGGVAFRVADASNFYIAFLSGTNYILARVVGGAYTQLGSYAVTAAAGDVIRVLASGSSLTVFRNGTQLGAVTDSSVTSTRHGLFTNNAGAAAYRVDNFAVKAV